MGLTEGLKSINVKQKKWKYSKLPTYPKMKVSRLKY